MANTKPLVGILMGSDSDFETMKKAQDACHEFGVATEILVSSAHRNPEDTATYAKTAAKRGIKVLIAGAGGAAHLAGVLAAFSTLPIIAVPIDAGSLKGLDSLLAMVQMPAGIPVATVAINGARNAGLLAVQILATSDSRLQAKLKTFKDNLAAATRAKNKKLGQAK
jgi:5-(carboxyamino)imidazole ribonucleotide mutase